MAKSNQQVEEEQVAETEPEARPIQAGGEVLWRTSRHPVIRCHWWNQLPERLMGVYLWGSRIKEESRRTPMVRMTFSHSQLARALHPILLILDLAMVIHALVIYKLDY